MKSIKTVLGVLLATALFAFTTGAATNAPVVTQTPVATSDWTLSLSGAGSVGVDSDADAAFGTEFELGHDGKLILPFNGGIRQGIAWSDTDGSAWNFSTKLFADVPVLRLGSVQFDVGANVGALYGDTDTVWTAAPEAVVRLYLKEDVDVFLRAEYPFDLDKLEAVKTVSLALGIRVRF